MGETAEVTISIAILCVPQAAPNDARAYGHRSTSDCSRETVEPMKRRALLAVALTLVLSSCGGTESCPPEDYPLVYSGFGTMSTRIGDGRYFEDELDRTLTLVPVGTDDPATRWRFFIGAYCTFEIESLEMCGFSDDSVRLQFAPLGSRPDCTWTTTDGGTAVWSPSAAELQWREDSLSFEIVGPVTYTLDGSIREGDAIFSFVGSAGL